MFKDALGKAAWFLAGVFVAIGISGHAQFVHKVSNLTVSAEPAYCNHGQSTPGTFWQPGRSTNNDLKGSCFSLGLEEKLNDRWSWKVAYQNLGEVRARDNHATQWDEEGPLPDSALPPCDPKTKHGCKAIMSGQGTTEGISVSVIRNYPLRDKAILRLEGGLLFFQHDFHAWYTRLEDGTVGYVTERSGMDRLPAPMLGAGIEWKGLTVAIQHFFPVGHRAQSVENFKVTKFLFAFRKPL